jgi:hypothetical protein
MQDSLLESLSYGAWKAALEPKIAGSWNLHTLLPTNIDFFILLSSIVGIAGQIGQANYGAGNTFQDALARYRVQHGLTAIFIDLGVMTSVGRIADDASVAKRFIYSDSLLTLGAHELFILLGHYYKASTLITRNCKSTYGWACEGET